MTRSEGRRVKGPMRGSTGFLLTLLLLPCVAAAWTIGGRFGLEVEGLGEEFQSYGLFDERVRPGESIESQLDSKPILARTATTLGLLEVRLDGKPSSRSWLRVMEAARLGGSRARHSLQCEAEFRSARNHFKIENGWDVQGGEDEPAAGAAASLTGTWDRDSLPGDLRAQLRAGADWSHTDDTLLAPVLEYRTFRTQLELRRSLAGEFEVRGSARYKHKEALSSRIGSYDAGTAEVEAEGPLGSRSRTEILMSAEDRAYRADSLGIPSSRLYDLSARYEVRASDILRPYTEHCFEWQDYRGSSGIFQDHRSWKGQIGTDLLLRGGGRDPAEAAASPISDWRLRIGSQAELFRSGTDSLSFSSTFDSFGGLFGLAREGGELFWFDLSLEVGRREYRNDTDAGRLVFEGLNLSLSSSDYTYVRASMLTQWTPRPWVRAEAFLQWDDELHVRSTDDFRLWIINVSLTHPF